MTIGRLLSESPPAHASFGALLGADAPGAAAAAETLGSPSVVGALTGATFAAGWWAGRPEARAVLRLGAARQGRSDGARPWWPRRARGGGESGLADALQVLAGLLRGGSAVRAAITDAAASPAGEAVGWPGLAAQLRAGAGLAEALACWSHDADVPGRELAVAVALLASESGGRAAEAVDGVAVTLRDRAAVRAEARALAAQARASVAVLVGAPVVFGVLAAGADPRIGAFFASAPGLACLTAAAALDAAGAWWMARILRRVA